MNLHSGDPFWYVKNGLLYSYPSLCADLKTDVLILGAGISGALAAYYLLEKNLDITIIDKRDVASGSTCASTCLLQYEIDTQVSELIQKIGKKNAIQSYLMCRDSIYEIQEIDKWLSLKSGFEIKKSIYLASLKKDVKKLEEEFILRKGAGINLRFLEKDQLNREYNIEAPAALISEDGAQMDAYRFTQELLNREAIKGVKIYDKTEAIKITYEKKGVKIITDNGYTIQAKYLVYANGYEAQDYLNQPYSRLHSTYVVVSEPIDKPPFDFVLWESARPYLYMRTTSENRIIVGGKDEVFYSPGKRNKLLTIKTKQLVKAFSKKFPDIPFIPDYSWTGTFAESKDGLPYIGKHKDHPFSFFSLGYGGNGITFSLIAAKLISDSILKKKVPYQNIFSFYR